MSSSNWSYDNQESWKSIPGCQAGGNHQSPIDIKNADVKESNLKPLTLSPNWFQGVRGSLINTGKSLMFQASEDTNALSIQTDSGKYELVQFHFHWGPCCGRGSEHTVNGSYQDSELHFVFKNSDELRDDLTVLGVLLKANPEQPMTEAWKLLSSPPKYDQSTAISNFPITQLLPSPLSYWRYSGSLTTPLCLEIVNWHVAHKVLHMPTVALQQWREMESDKPGIPLASNYRDIQALNDREIKNFVD